VTADPPLGTGLADAPAWRARCALAVAVAGFIGHLAGNRLYPQRSEQVPSDFFLVPFGLLAGFLVAACARLVRPQWGGGEMWRVLFLAAAAYAGMNFNYAKGRAIPPGILLEFEPYTATADRCNASCPPDTEWTVQGSVRVRAIRVEGTITSMEIRSSEMPPSGGNTLTNDPRLFRFRGPTVRLTASEIAGERHLKPHDVVAYPIRYSYQNRGAESARQLVVSVELTDTHGSPVYGAGVWHVR
jgi:hypothetical protein